MVDLSLWTREGLAARCPPLVRKAVYLLSWIVAIIFIVAVILYAIVRAAQAPKSHQQVTTGIMTLNSPPSGGIPFPVVTICPGYVATNNPPALTAVSCNWEQNGTITGSCLATQMQVQVVIEGRSVPCISYNNAYSTGTGVMTASNSASEISITTSINSASIPQGEIVGMYAIFSPQGPAPTGMGFQNTAIINVGQETLVMARYIQSSTSQIGTTQSQSYTYSYQIVSSAGNLNMPTPNSATIDLIFPDPYMFTQSQTAITVQLDWIGEVGGLAALLYFFHAAIFWVILLFSVCLCGQRHTENLEPAPKERLFE